MEENVLHGKELKNVRIRTRLHNIIYKEKSFFFMVFAMTGLLCVGAFYTYRTIKAPHSYADLAIMIFVDVCSLFLCYLVYCVLCQWSEVVGRLRMDIKTGQARVANMDLTSYTVIEERHTKAVTDRVEALGADIVEGINRGTKDSMEYISKTFASVLNETMVNMFDNTMKQANATNANVNELQKKMEKIADRFDAMDERYTSISSFMNSILASGIIPESTLASTGESAPVVPNIFEEEIKTPEPAVVPQSQAEEEQEQEDDDYDDAYDEPDENYNEDNSYYDRQTEKEMLMEEQRLYGNGETDEDLLEESEDDEDPSEEGMKTVDAEDAGTEVSAELKNLGI